MRLYLVSNNLVIENIEYETGENVDEKRLARPLSIDGEKEAIKLIKRIKADMIYSSNYASAVATAKYYAEYLHDKINISSLLNDSKIGNLQNRNIKMLRFMQERDFDFKFMEGESLNDTNKRMTEVIKKILENNPDRNIAIFTQKRAIMSYLLNYLEKGYNLDDRLILTYKDRVIIDDIDNDIDIIRMDFEDGHLIDVNVIE